MKSVKQNQKQVEVLNKEWKSKANDDSGPQCMDIETNPPGILLVVENPPNQDKHCSPKKT